MNLFEKTRFSKHIQKLYAYLWLLRFPCTPQGWWPRPDHGMAGKWWWKLRGEANFWSSWWRQWQGMVCHRFQDTPTHIIHKNFIRGYTRLPAIQHLTYHLGYSQWMLFFLACHVTVVSHHLPWLSQNLRSYNMLSHSYRWNSHLHNPTTSFIPSSKPSMDSKDRTTNPTETVVNSTCSIFFWG